MSESVWWKEYKQSGMFHILPLCFHRVPLFLYLNPYRPSNASPTQITSTPTTQQKQTTFHRVSWSQSKLCLVPNSNSSKGVLKIASFWRPYPWAMRLKSQVMTKEISLRDYHDPSPSTGEAAKGSGMAALHLHLLWRSDKQPMGSCLLLTIFYCH